MLKGGLRKWIEEGRSVTSEVQEGVKGNYVASLLTKHVASLGDVLENCDSQQSTVLDARPEARFYGEVPEPRHGLKVAICPMQLAFGQPEFSNFYLHLFGGKPSEISFFKQLIELSVVLHAL